MSTTVRHILQFKGPQVWSIHPGATVFEALRMMADKDIGAVLVMEGERLVGVMTEREYARKVILQGKSSRETKVSDIMGTDLTAIHPEQTLEECMDLMTQHHVRYLPVVENNEVIGVISLGDVVYNIIHRQRQTIKEMESKKI